MAYPDPSYPNRLQVVFCGEESPEWGYGTHNMWILGETLYDQGYWDMGWWCVPSAISGQTYQDRVPISDDAYSGPWSGSDGTRYLSVIGESFTYAYPSPTPSLYLQHGTAIGDITFNVTPFSVPAGRTIYGINFYYLVSEPVSGANHFHVRVKIGGSYYKSEYFSITPSTTWNWNRNVMHLDPTTGLPWTPAGVNAIQAIGLQSDDANPVFYVAGVLARVCYSDPTTDLGDGSNWVEVTFRDGNNFPNGYPAYGDHCSDNLLNVIPGFFIPWEDSIRKYYIYNFPHTDEKIYFDPATISPGGSSFQIGDKIYPAAVNPYYTGSLVVEIDTNENWIKVVPDPAEPYPSHVSGGMNIEVDHPVSGWFYVDLLPWIEEPTSFSESRAELEGRGYLSIYIDELTEALKVFEKINEAIFSYLYNGYNGKYRYRVFTPEPGGDLPTFTDDDIFSFKERVDASEIISNLRVEYAYRAEQDYPQVILLESLQSQYLQRSPIKVSKEIRLPFTQRNDAQYWAERAILMAGERLVLYDVELSPRAWTLEPGDFITIIYSRQSINMVMEVLEVNRDLATGVVDVVLSDQHGYLSGEGGGGGTTKDLGAWWWEDADSAGFLPTQFSGLTGYGTGAVSPWNPAWDPAIKAWVRQNVGYWCDDTTDRADVSDPDSYFASRWM